MRGDQTLNLIIGIAYLMIPCMVISAFIWGFANYPFTLINLLALICVLVPPLSGGVGESHGLRNTASGKPAYRWSRADGKYAICLLASLPFCILIDVALSYVKEWKQLRISTYNPQATFAEFDQLFISAGGPIPEDCKESLFEQEWKGKKVTWDSGEIESVNLSNPAKVKVSIKHLPHTIFSDVNLYLLPEKADTGKFLSSGKIVKYTGYVMERGGAWSNTQVVDGEILEVDGKPYVLYWRQVNLHQVLTTGDDKLMVELIQMDRDALLERDESYGATPLHWAAFLGHEKLVNLLLSYPEVRQAINTKNKTGQTPLYQAEQAKHPDIVRILRSYGAE